MVQQHQAWGCMLPIQLQKFCEWVQTIQKQLGLIMISNCRDVAMVCSGTIYALLPLEVIGIDTYDLLWDEDCPGTHAFDIVRRKNDQTMHCLCPLSEKAHWQNPDLCILSIIAEYQKSAGLTVSPAPRRSGRGLCALRAESSFGRQPVGESV
eukprot:3764287-Rhodomonas_salina.1